MLRRVLYYSQDTLFCIRNKAGKLESTNKFNKREIKNPSIRRELESVGKINLKASRSLLYLQFRIHVCTVFYTYIFCGYVYVCSCIYIYKMSEADYTVGIYTLNRMFTAALIGSTRRGLETTNQEKGQMLADQGMSA